ncbi:hypothetical protein K466DRAFT_601883 [Polyporus arcularius HHB13444]|uniref:Uncharacterized protein n=1 Tax=Polyporus arcularius HHB13444 TaxID=1314778 RepID=A0A5C3P8N2_9APHY|nr:hypothetical protein K466DRAFT_601883 [Polyporus arcularius HHB13444]
MPTALDVPTNQAHAHPRKIPNLIRSVDSSLAAILLHCATVQESVQAVHHTVQVVNQYETARERTLADFRAHLDHQLAHTEVVLGRRLSAVEAQLAAQTDGGLRRRLCAVEAELAGLKSLLRSSLLGDLQPGASPLPYSLPSSPPSPSPASCPHLPQPSPLSPPPPSTSPPPITSTPPTIPTSPIAATRAHQAHGPSADWAILPSFRTSDVASSVPPSAVFTMSKARWDHDLAVSTIVPPE